MREECVWMPKYMPNDLVIRSADHLTWHSEATKISMLSEAEKLLSHQQQTKRAAWVSFPDVSESKPSPARRIQYPVRLSVCGLCT